MAPRLAALLLLCARPALPFTAPCWRASTRVRTARAAALTATTTLPAAPVSPPALEAPKPPRIGKGVRPAPSGRVRRALWATRRTLLIWSCVMGQIWRYSALQRRRLRGDALVAARRAYAAGLRDTLITLGPTFIKIGQLLSTRIDVLSPEVIDELSRLQNEVPSFPARRARAVIARELGAEKSAELFAAFDETPLAAASLAQVHRATLASGDEVVVKVQRENLEDLFKVDLANIDVVARLADRLDPQTESAQSNWKAIADASGVVLQREVDFNIERRACDAFRANFAADASVKIPRTHAAYSSARVLTMEYVPGVKISDTAALASRGFDAARLSTRLTTSYLDQLCRHGVFLHRDPRG